MGYPGPQGNPTSYDPFGERRLIVPIDFSLAAWNTVATHEVFAVTGLVRIAIIWRITEALAGGAGALISFGSELSTTAYSGTIGFAAMVAGRIVDRAAVGAVARYIPTEGIILFPKGDGVWSDMVAEDVDFGYEITVNPMTDGTIQGIAFWTPLSPDGSVVAGAGGVL